MKRGVMLLSVRLHCRFRRSWLWLMREYRGLLEAAAPAPRGGPAGCHRRTTLSMPLVASTGRVGWGCTQLTTSSSAFKAWICRCTEVGLDIN